MSGSSPPIFLMRHGETVFNEEGRYQGRLDSPLTKRGIAQALSVSKALVDRLGGETVRVLSSPLERAQRTAGILAETFPDPISVEVDERLMEVAMGAWDGLTRAEIADRWPDARRGRSKREWVFHGPGGEALEEVAARLKDLLSDVKLRDEAHVLVSHAMSGRVLRGLHADLPLLEALKLEAPQEMAFELEPGGSISTVKGL